MTRHIFTLLHDIRSPLTKLVLKHGQSPDIDRIVVATHQLGLLFSLSDKDLDKDLLLEELSTLKTQLSRQLESDPDRKKPSTRTTLYLIRRLERITKSSH